MGDLNGGVRDLDRCFQQLRFGAGKPSDPGRCLRSGLPPSTRAVDLRDHDVAEKNRRGAGHYAKNAQFGLKVRPSRSIRTIDPKKSGRAIDMETKSIEQVSLIPTSAAGELEKQQIAERRDLVRAVTAINATELFGENYELTFVFDRQSKRTLIRIIDRETKEVIRQLPNEYALRIASQLRAE